MAKELFVERKFSAGSLDLISKANVIITEYRRGGFTLTLRQLYYQFVARGMIANKLTEYKRLGSIINDGRLAGLIDWSSIEDRTRNVRTHAFWSSPGGIINAAAQGYAENLWATQHYRPEVWIEKDALIGVIEPVCDRYRVPYFACRGYSSQSEQYRAGKRFEKAFDEGKTPIIFHLGDHDPSGIDMTRDNADRIAMFAGQHVRVKRLALNMPQIDEYSPPPNPAKETDSRSAGYIEQFGNSSWELDALDPRVIDRLIADEIKNIIDEDAWDEAKRAEAENMESLKDAAHRWDDVAAWLKETEE